EPTGAVAKVSLHREIVTAYGPEPRWSIHDQDEAWVKLTEEGESGPKIRPNGIVNGQQVNIPILPLIGPEGRRRLERPYEASLFPRIGFGPFLRSLGGRQRRPPSVEPKPSVRYHSGRARILTLCQDLWAKGQSQ
ncbi:hypothetical protein Gohar_017319, partial [Gossypium harknessii]|nr:hypothetical protein [Gossypium harknessii]